MPTPLYAGLTSEEQLYVFEAAPENTRKVIVSTNIAEASVTVAGVVFVIDCGFVKLRAFNPATNMDTLTATAVSKASATQRAGRAGRTKPGKCFRLYTQSAYQNLLEASIPEIQRSNLAPIILQLKALGIDNVARFDFLTSPPAELAIRGLELLYSLGALDEYAKLTRPLGVRMAELAVEPMMAKCLLEASRFGCVGEMLTISAMTSLQGSIWFNHHQQHPDGDRKSQESARRKFAAAEGDHLTLLNVYQAFVGPGKKGVKWCRHHQLNFQAMTRAVSIRAQLKRFLERFGIEVDESLRATNGLDDPASSSSSPLAGHTGGADVIIDNPNDNHNDPDISKAEAIRRCLTTGFFAHAARMHSDGTFRPVVNHGGHHHHHDNNTANLHAHPSSVLFVRSIHLSLSFPPLLLPFFFW